MSTAESLGSPHERVSTVAATAALRPVEDKVVVCMVAEMETLHADTAHLAEPTRPAAVGDGPAFPDRGANSRLRSVRDELGGLEVGLLTEDGSVELVREV